MKQFLKKYIRLVIVIVLLFIIYMGYLTSKQSVNVDEELDKAISDYIIEHNKSGYEESSYKAFEAHKIYGVEDKDDLINVYMYSLQEVYSFVDKKFKLQGSWSEPAFMAFKNYNGKYSVIEYKEAEVGSKDLESMMEIFPREYAKKAIYDDAQSTGLYFDIRKQAKKWLKDEGKGDFSLE